MLKLLKQAEIVGALRPLDYHFAQYIAPHSPLALAVALLSLESSIGHVCLPLSYLSKPRLWFEGRWPKLAQSLWQQAQQPDINSWNTLLQHCDAVSEGQHATPLILENQHLYLHRLWQDETQVAHFFQDPHWPSAIDQQALQGILSQLFDDPSAAQIINWQKVAAAVAASRRIALILGGPGTGKTSTVIRLLAALILLSGHQGLRIQLAAPTGKAATRLSDAVNQACQQLPVDHLTKAAIPTQAVTLHRLLGAQSDSQHWRYHRQHPLAVDLVVVDEASMIDLSMMARLIEALPAQARLILLGDSNQLASIEAGAVLSDLSPQAKHRYTPERAAELSLLTGYRLPFSTENSPSSVMHDSLALLRTRYRFQENSSLDDLAHWIQKGDRESVLACLQQSAPSITWHLLDHQCYPALLQRCVKGYSAYLQLASTGAKPAQILKAFNTFQLLCPLRQGPLGVQTLNQQIEQALQRAGLITLSTGSAWYPGRPVMVLLNHYALGLSNGDIGITLPDESGRLRVYFSNPIASDQPLAILPSRLPPHETVYAMTVHKAQGSEFEHTLLVLPPTWAALLTRELLYTATTRAKSTLTLYATASVLSSTLNSRTKRCSGLARRLKNLTTHP